MSAGKASRGPAPLRPCIGMGVRLHRVHSREGAGRSPQGAGQHRDSSRRGAFGAAARAGGAAGMGVQAAAGEQHG
eukprot:scaffold87832_cov23-Tisochrysis_lutea.AAC.4